VDCVRVFGWRSASRLRQRFAGYGRIVDPNAKSLDQPAISWDVITLLLSNYVAGHDVVRREALDLAIAQYFDLLRQKLAEGSEGPLDAEFLPEGEEPANYDHRYDRVADLRHALTGVEPFGEESERRRQPQNKCEKMGEFPYQA
jgi:hypothetical protein